VVIVVIGDEILSGHTVDSNSPWLVQRLVRSGHRVSRIVVIPDDVDEIASTLRQLLDQKTDTVFIMGGIGPTHDDVTFEGVARGLGVELSYSPKAASLMYQYLSLRNPDLDRDTIDTDPGVIKMATIPECAEPLINREGSAPALEIVRNGSTLFVLPGVPREFKHVLDSEILDKRLPECRDAQVFVDLPVSATERSMMDLLKTCSDNHPDVKLGSYPQPDRVVILRLSGCKEAVDDCLEELKSRLLDAFGKSVMVTSR